MAGITLVGGPAGWRGPDIADGGDWRLALDAAHRAELLAAVGSVESAGVALSDLSPEDFPLPTLGPLLGRFTDELMDGRGFGLLRGLPVTELTEHQREIVAVGVARHVGDLAPQPGDVPLLHVRDTGADPANPTSRSYQHSRRLGYHADPTDVVALLCVRPAKSGGLSSIVSAVAVHDEIVRGRPDLAETLYQPWWHDRRTGDGPDSFFTRPVYTAREDGGVTTFYGPDYMRSAQRGVHVPPFTADQTEAMDVLDRLNDDPRFVLTMDLRPGDMQFLNNAVVLHSRTPFEDHPEPERRRDLIRLWLTDERRRG